MNAGKLPSVGARIRAARQAAHLGQAELAARCGWEAVNSRIGNYEQEKRTPTYSDLIKIAKEIGIDPAFLAFGTDAVEFLHSIQIPYYEALSQMAKGKKRTVELVYPTNVSPRAFCIPVPGSEFKPFRKGELIVVDPAVKPHAGSYVAIYTDASTLSIVRCTEVRSVPLYQSLADGKQLPATTHRDHFIGVITSSITLHR